MLYSAPVCALTFVARLDVPDGPVFGTGIGLI